MVKKKKKILGTSRFVSRGIFFSSSVTVVSPFYNARAFPDHTTTHAAALGATTAATTTSGDRGEIEERFERREEEIRFFFESRRHADPVRRQRREGTKKREQKIKAREIRNVVHERERRRDADEGDG